MTEVTKDNFWETDLSDLPGAIKINDQTPILNSVGGIPMYTYTQEEINKGVGNILNK